ncbi:unnamed protein product [Pedinophyceae sp. YPF-701]|nr:unnamed protein product [Pedinophyceae sp. YPF-701]
MCVEEARRIHTLLIDNYDSYTYNLYQMVAAVNGAPPTVVLNDECRWSDLEARVRAGEFHNIIISPGPGTPERASDAGVCLDALRTLPDVPILGVCFGHQALALVHGASVVRAPEPIHGRLSEISHTSHALFRNTPTGQGQGNDVVRYHSLTVDPASLPECLEPIAWTTGLDHALRLGKSATEHAASLNGGAAAREDARQAFERGAVLMGIAHTSRPHYGVQFHPESIGTSHGMELLRNFRDLTCQHLRLPLEPRPPPVPVPTAQQAAQGWRGGCDAGETLALTWRKLAGVLDAVGGSEGVFSRVLGQVEAGGDVFWLDSAATDRGRFSFMGGPGGRLWRRVTYRLPEPDAEDGPYVYAGPGARTNPPPGDLTVRDSAGGVEVLKQSIWEFLDAQLQRWTAASAAASQELPFDFWGGFVGYLGYELKAETGATRSYRSATPDAAFFLADRFVAVDHHAGDVYVVSVHPAEDAATDARTWIDDVERRLSPDAAPPQPSAAEANGAHAHAAPQPPFQLRRTRPRYVEDIGACHDALYAGESYEVCLTNALCRKPAPPAGQLYRTLRKGNPAPYGAFFDFGGGADGPQICCSSPERFLRRGRGGWLEARPIKGTAARVAGDPAGDAKAAAALVASEKDRAENLMIVDLLRNDLGRVCDVGSVHVPGLIELESFATVHQLVSTVCGLERAGSRPTESIVAAFPGGSMTGAPKVRTCGIIDRLEGCARGVYSGSLGYISFSGCFDLNIVIRTAVIHQGEVTIGAGGAIVVQSDAESEYEEMRLKARALMRCVGLVDGTGQPAEVDDTVPYGNGAKGTAAPPAS